MSRPPPRRAVPAREKPRLRVRPARPADLAVLVRHRRLMFEEIGGWSPRALERSESAYRRWVLHERATHRFFGFVVEDPSVGVVGSGVLWLQPSQPRPAPLDRLDMPYLMSMYTDPAFRGRGVASSLVRTMVRWATDRGYRRIFLHASKAGRSVYEGLGFESTNEMRLELSVRPRRRG